MSGDYTIFLWLLKLGALPNLYFLVRTAAVKADALIIVPAQIFFAVSIYRCLFPVHYEHYVVFHDSVLSSVFATRLLATFSEVAYLFLLAHVLQLLNVDNVAWVNVIAWWMVLQVMVCQVCVWWRYSPSASRSTSTKSWGGGSCTRPIRLSAPICT
jgi:hypothetical protein